MTWRPSPSASHFVFLLTTESPTPNSFSLILFQSYFTLLLALLVVSSVLAAAQGTKLVKVRREFGFLIFFSFAAAASKACGERALSLSLHQPLPDSPHRSTPMPLPRFRASMSSSFYGQKSRRKTRNYGHARLGSAPRNSRRGRKSATRHFFSSLPGLSSPFLPLTHLRLFLSLSPSPPRLATTNRPPPPTAAAASSRGASSPPSISSPLPPLLLPL